MEYDFSGWATRANVKCSDGRTIMPNAFKHNNGVTVPLVWMHQHTDPGAVLGHAILENRPEGVYAYGKFNSTTAGTQAKELVESGDIQSLSIFANNLKENGKNVMHGNIRELSLVIAGANEGAKIENVMSHDDASGECAVICFGDGLFLSHGMLTIDEEAIKNAKPIEEETPEPVIEHSEEPIVEEPAVEEPIIEHAGEGLTGKSPKEVFDSMTEEQQTLVYAMLGYAEDANNNPEDSEGGKTTMKHNVFEGLTHSDGSELTHDDVLAAIADGQSEGSMKRAFLAHGIDNIDYLMPDAKLVGDLPGIYSRKMDWVTGVLNGVHKTPFSRIKSVFADITGDDARAKGYLKGNRKEEEVFGLLRRTTTPTTIYKKQEMDRDDVVDITDLDVIAFLKREMRTMLDEELARAIMIGDGRSSASKDKINEGNIRPIWTDDEFYSIKHLLPLASTATAKEKAEAFIEGCIRSRKEYKGSGNPVLYADEDIITECVLLKDTTGRRLYSNLGDLATALRASSIVTIPAMEGLKRDVSGVSRDLLGILVNLDDYNLGADKGGAVNMFDDFDIDYNKQKYLIETRCSGALTVPKSAIVIETLSAATTQG